jgi:hypothetical protein
MVDLIEMNEENGINMSSPDEKMSNIDSILFDQDDGPASVLFMDKSSGVDSTLDSIHPDQFCDDSGTHDGVYKSSEDHHLINSRNVRFIDMDVSEEEKRSQSDPGSESDLIQLLRERLVQVQTDLSTERATRKRKDKNLVKLAKELNKRTSDSHEKESKIHEMAKRINEMESSVQSHHIENVQEVQTYREAYRENETRIVELDGAVSNLRKQLLEANLEADLLRTKLSSDMIQGAPRQADENENRTMDEGIAVHQNRSQLSRLGRAIFISLLFSLMVVTAILHFGNSSELISLNSVCAPVMPGSVLQNYSKSDVFEAPWWAPSTMKTQLFEIFCPDRPRTRMSWKGDKLIIHNLSEGNIKNPSIIWQGGAALGAKVDANEITIKSVWGTKKSKAPWTE